MWEPGRIDRLLLAGLAAGAVIGVGAVWAQDAATSARNLVTAQSPALQAGPTTGPTGASVPGFAGDTPGLQTLASDPTALQAAGEAAALAGSPQYGIAQDGLAAPGRAGISAADSWLDRSHAAHADPMSLAHAGGTTAAGSEDLVCRSETRTDTQTSTSLYTCESSTTIAVDTRACTQSYQPNIADYGATCTETFNYPTGRFDASPECSTAPSDRNCSAGGRVCSSPSTPVVSAYDCQAGYTDSTSTTTSTYECSEGYSGSGATGASCGGSTYVDVVWAPMDCDDQTVQGGCRGVDPACQLTGSEPYGRAGALSHYHYNCPGDGGGGVDYACGGIDPSCTLTGETCTEPGGYRTFGFGLQVYRACWGYTRTYSCPGGRVDAPGCFPPPGASPAGSDCTATDADGACTQFNRRFLVTTTTTTHNPAPGCSPGLGCTLVGSDCAATDAGGACTAFNQHYACTSDPAGGCAQWQTPYVCRGDTGGTWVDDAGCPAAGDAACRVASTACIEAAATRRIAGADVYADCWRRQTDYSCKTYSTTDDCDPAPGCTKTQDNCLDEPPGADGCLAMDHVYACVATTTTTTTVDRCENRMCLGDSCFTLSKEQNGDFTQVYSQLAAIDQAGKDYATNPDLTIFKGKPLRCKKAVLGFANCCKDSGWGISIGLARCDETEKQLIAEQDKKATHYVGTYCSNKSLFGVCLEKAMSYCGFGSSMPRLVQEAGRPQVGKAWGSPKTPDCSGFTVDEFQRLDLTNVDFSDFYREKLAGFAAPGEGGTVSNIQSSLQALYDAAVPTRRPDE